MSTEAIIEIEEGDDLVWSGTLDALSTEWPSVDGLVGFEGDGDEYSLTFAEGRTFTIRTSTRLSWWAVVVAWVREAWRALRGQY